MKYVISLCVIVLFSGCTFLKLDSMPMKNKVPSLKSQVKDLNETNVTVDNTVKITVKIDKEKKVQESLEVIENVFSDELYFQRDKVHENRYLMVIKYLDALALEKDALNAIYIKNMNIWSKKQSEEFKHILEENQYFSLCSDKKYWDNLEFEDELVQKEILQSVLFLKYLTNLKYGCEKWVESNSKIKNENDKKEMNYHHLLSLLPHDVLIEKVIQIFLPTEERFFSKLDEYKALVESTVNKNELKKKRLELERLKVLTEKPNYINRKEN